MQTTAEPVGKRTFVGHRPLRITSTIRDRVVVVSLVAPYRELREEFKAATGLTEIYVHTTEARGREAKHASDYEAPLERFIDIDTTGSSVESSLASLLMQLPA